MNWYFYKIFLPLCILWFFSLLGFIFNLYEVSFLTIFIVWFLIGPVGIGVGFHRLFSHRQFETTRFIEVILATLGTLAAYAPIIFWVTNHQHHHQTSDTPQDSSSPSQYGFVESFLLYRLRQSALKTVEVKSYCSRKAIMDPYLRWLSRNFTRIFWSITVLLGVLNVGLLINGFLIPVFIEHLRVNLISSLSHLSVPFSYRNHETRDKSHNNVIIGLLTFGFGWHNNHHFNERKLLLKERYWEIDIEGLIARMIQKDRTK